MDKECISPNELEEGDLVAYLEGDATEDVINHLHRCTACQIRVAKLRNTESRLLGVLYRASCPTPEALMYYRVGWLSQIEREQIDTHLAICIHCPKELATFPQPPTLEPKRTWLDKARQLGKELITASLIFQAPLEASFQRARGDDEGQKLEFEAHPYQTRMHIMPNPNTSGLYDIEAWLMLEEEEIPPPSLTARVLILQDERVIASTDLEPITGYFTLAGIREGSYALQVELTSTLLVIDELNIQAYGSSTTG